MVNYCSQEITERSNNKLFKCYWPKQTMGIRIHSRLMFKYRKDLVCPFFSQPVRSLRSRNSRNFVGGNHESWTTDKENPASQPIQNSRITAGFFLYSQITRSISAESRITQYPFQTLLYLAALPGTMRGIEGYII